MLAAATLASPSTRIEASHAHVVSTPRLSLSLSGAGLHHDTNA